MPSKRNLHVWFAVAGIFLVFTIVNLKAAHNNSPTRLAILIAGALLCGLAPLAAFMWNLKRNGRLHIRRSGLFAVILMIVGILGPSRVDALVPWRFGDIFGLLFWSVFALLCFVLLRYWYTTRRQNQTVHPSPRKDFA